MMSKFVAAVIVVSVFLNFYLFFRKNDAGVINDSNECFVVQDDISSIDNAITPHEDFPKFRSYSISGEVTKFLDFYIRGTISGSVKNKYDIEIPLSFIRNIQEIVYFFNDYRILFSEGDRISLFYRLSDGKIVYLRFENGRRKSVHETFLFNSKGKEVYVTSDGFHLQPCITNGPFNDCPQVSFVTEQNSLVPLFEMDDTRNIRLPFLAKLIGTSNTSSMGGEVEVIYSNHLVRGVFKGLSFINSNLRKDALYKPDFVIGKGGYPLQGGKKGVIYYLRRRDNTPLSPFSFHHTEKIEVESERRPNLVIASNFYTRWFQSGINFERKHY